MFPQEKLPWVEKIRVSKRKIGQLQRDQEKIAKLLAEIQRCVDENKRAKAIVDEQKSNERIVRRQPQLEQLASKKEKICVTLIQKLHKAKARGRQKKSGKQQIPRSTYYRDRNIWPSSKWSNQRRNDHSYYHYYNDPYGARWGHYPYGYTSYGDELCCYPSSDGNDTCGVWDHMYSNSDKTAFEPSDPWQNVDTALAAYLAADTAMSAAHLALLHAEVSELGGDVLDGVASTLDAGASLPAKLDDISESTGIPTDMLSEVVDANGLDPVAVQEDLPPIPEFDGGDWDDGAVDADDAVEMYAGAEPRHLDDNDPSGNSGHSALSGARRRSQGRKNSRTMRKIRGRQKHVGYAKLSIVPSSPQLQQVEMSDAWPNDVVISWKAQVQNHLIEAIAISDLINDIPMQQSHTLLHEWTSSSARNGMDVVIVTQCSLDRLTSLEAQLQRWQGKSAVAVYVSSTESKSDAMVSIQNMVSRGNFNCAIMLVEGAPFDDEPYPINYLRNVALLESQRQHLRFHPTLEQSAVLLGKSGPLPFTLGRSSF